MAEVSKTLVELVDERPNIDNSETFVQLWDIYRSARQLFDKRFKVSMDLGCAEFVPEYEGLPGTGARGMVSAWSGPEIDWFIHSWIGNPKHSFTNMHFTVWLGPHIKVPHLAIALGTVPDVFFYCDFLARADTTIDLDHFDRYFGGETNDEYFAFRRNPNMVQFVSPSNYVRRVMSESGICITSQSSPENIKFIGDMVFKRLNRWLKWVDEAAPVPVAERAALAERDLALRKNCALRDPANVIGDRLFGPAMTERLVSTLWGGNRVSQRPM